MVLQATIKTWRSWTNPGLVRFQNGSLISTSANGRAVARTREAEHAVGAPYDDNDLKRLAQTLVDSGDAAMDVT